MLVFVSNEFQVSFKISSNYVIVTVSFERIFNIIIKCEKDTHEWKSCEQPKVSSSSTNEIGQINQSCRSIYRDISGSIIDVYISPTSRNQWIIVVLRKCRVSRIFSWIRWVCIIVICLDMFFGGCGDVLIREFSEPNIIGILVICTYTYIILNRIARSLKKMKLVQNYVWFVWHLVLEVYFGILEPALRSWGAT